MDIDIYMNSKLIRDGTRIKSSHINLDYNKKIVCPHCEYKEKIIENKNE